MPHTITEATPSRAGSIVQVFGPPLVLCGRPTDFAALTAGEFVVDLGCRSGLDVFLAAKKVGPGGKVIGIQTSQKTIEHVLARAKGPIDGELFTNVEFRLGTIDNVPLPDGSAHCIISNCATSLASDKEAVFREMFRVLRPAGRVAVSELVLRKTPPPDFEKIVFPRLGLMAGAILIDVYEDGLVRAGFTCVRLVDTNKDLNAQLRIESQGPCCSADISEGGVARLGGNCSEAGIATSRGCEIGVSFAEVLSRHDVNEYVAAIQVFAVKSR